MTKRIVETSILFICSSTYRCTAIPPSDTRKVDLCFTIVFTTARITSLTSYTITNTTCSAIFQSIFQFIFSTTTVLFYPSGTRSWLKTFWAILITSLLRMASCIFSLIKKFRNDVKSWMRSTIATSFYMITIFIITKVFTISLTGCSSDEYVGVTSLVTTVFSSTVPPEIS